MQRNEAERLKAELVRRTPSDGCARCARLVDAISEALAYLTTDPQNALRRAETIRRLTAVLGS